MRALKTLAVAGMTASLGMAVAAVAAPATAVAQPLPPGDLSSRCRDLSYRDGAWQGYCRDARGEWRWTTVRGTYQNDRWSGGDRYDRWDDRYSDRYDERYRDRYDDRWNDRYSDRWNDRYDDRWGSGGGWNQGGYDSITVYEDRGFRGRSITLRGPVEDLRNSGLNDRISSMRGSGDWEVCTDAYFRGDCRVLPGNVGDLGPTNFNDKISSIRPAGRW